MSLLPDRHPNLDFFVLDIADAVPKDDMATMEHPLFSLATKPGQAAFGISQRRQHLENQTIKPWPADDL